LAVFRNTNWDQIFSELIGIYAGCVHSGKRNVTVWRPSVCLSVPSTYIPWLTREQHATRPACISAGQ